MHQEKPAQHRAQRVRKPFAMDVCDNSQLLSPHYHVPVISELHCPCPVWTCYGNRFLKASPVLLLPGRASYPCGQISTSCKARASHLLSTPFNRQCLKNQSRLQSSPSEGELEGLGDSVGVRVMARQQSCSTQTRRACPAMLPALAHSPVITRQSIAMRQGQGQARKPCRHSIHTT